MKIKSRSQARKLAVQAIYSWQLSGNSFFDFNIFSYKKIEFDLNYFNRLFIGVLKNVSKLDKKISLFFFNYLGQVEKAVLRLAIFEILYCKEIPYKVIINEAIEITKIFCSKKSYKFINSVLDTIIHVHIK